MNHHPAIIRNRTALIAVAAVIAALIGRHGAASPIARGLRNAALALLRPAESALRRLIVIAARGLEVSLAIRPFLRGALGQRTSGSIRLPAFRLFDRHKRFTLNKISPPPPLGTPRIRTFWGLTVTAPPTPVAVPRKEPSALVDVARLHLRLAALERALAGKISGEAAEAAATAAPPRSPAGLPREPGSRRGSCAQGMPHHGACCAGAQHLLIHACTTVSTQNRRTRARRAVVSLLRQP